MKQKYLKGVKSSASQFAQHIHKQNKHFSLEYLYKITDWMFVLYCHRYVNIVRYIQIIAFIVTHVKNCLFCTKSYTSTLV